MKRKKSTKIVKQDKTENKYPKKILSYLQQKQGDGYRRKDISKALNVKKPTYFLFEEALNQLVQSGKVQKLKGGRYTLPQKQQAVRGILQTTRRGFGFVNSEAFEEDIFVAASKLSNAFSGDEVEIELISNGRGRSREGRVVRVINRHTTTFVGIFQENKYYRFVTPDSLRINVEFIIPEDKLNAAKSGQKVVVKLLSWEENQKNPQAEIVQVLGYPDEPGVDVASVVMGHGLPLQFSDELEKQASKVKFRITAKDLTERLDLRDELIFTIDPLDAKDFDDAVSLEQLPNGHQRLGVHIADVSHFVPVNSEFDLEAFKRGTSVYLVDRVIPMLPEHLSNNLCSLQPHQDRMAFSCFMELDSDFNVVEYEISPSVINSKRRFTYEEVQAILDDRQSSDEYAAILNRMHALSRKLRARRFRKGSIDFSTPEVRFKLNEKGEPIDVIPVVHMHSHELIEEFMLLANQTVTRLVQPPGAKKDEKIRPYPFIYRNHDRPDAEKLTKFGDFLKALGHKVTLKKNVTPAQFQQLLAGLEGGSDERVIKEVALRTMMKAVYAPYNAGHFGLAFDSYTHFTSPIRRYPDLIVHRLLKEYLQGPVTPARQKELARPLKKMCDRSSERERAAMEAERESVRLKQVEWISKFRGKEFDGVISGVTSFGLFVETTPHLIEGLVRMDAMTDDYYIFDERTYSMVGKELGRVYRLGDRVRIRVEHVDRERAEVDFRLLDPAKIKA